MPHDLASLSRCILEAAQCQTQGNQAKLRYFYNLEAVLADYLEDIAAVLEKPPVQKCLHTVTANIVEVTHGQDCWETACS